MKLGKRLGTILLACLLLLGLCSCGFSYGKMDAEKYISLGITAPEDIVISLSQDHDVTEDRIMDAIHDLLLDHKAAVNGGEKEGSTPVGDGDVIAFYYEVVTQDGKRVSEGYDVGGNTPYLMEMGAGMFPLKEVEEALLGIVPLDHKRVSAGKVAATDLVYLEYTYEDYSSGNVGYSLLTPVHMEEADALLGDGFAEGLVGAELGTYVTIYIKDDAGTITRAYRVRPRFIGKEEIKVTATYPEGYSNADLASQTVTVYIQTDYMVDYNVPTLTSDTVTNLFKLHQTASDPVAALKEQVRGELLLQEARQAAIREEVLNFLADRVTFIKLPKSKVKDLVGGMKEELEYLYEYSHENLYDYCVETFGQASMDSIDGFARAMYGVKEDLTMKEILTQEAEEQVRHDLVVYALAQQFGVSFTAEELEAGTQAIIDTYLEGTDTTERKLLKMWGGREYFEAQYYDAYVFIKLSDKITITYQ